MGKQKSVGGPASRSDMTATIQLSDVSARIVDDFEAATGKARMSIKVEWDGPGGNARYADARCDPPPGQRQVGDHTSMDINGSEVAFLSVVMDCDEAPVA